jgi:hypothetical protein
MSRVNTLVAVTRRLWQTDAALTAVGMLMLLAGLVAAAGLVLDPRVIGGAPAWMKPVKFGVSTGIYCLTLAWVFTYLPDWRRLRRIVGRSTAAIIALEVGIIDAQAWRGTTSHFNVGTPLDGILFAIMGVGIALQTLLSAGVAVALWRQTFGDRALGWALRLGMTFTIAGAMIGGLMTRPTRSQREALRDTGRMTVAGAHTVGAPDGGPGLPGTGWSTEHGDLRVPHFLGLHAVQVLPLAAFLINRRKRAERVGVRFVAVAAASHATLFATLLWQAFRGEAITNPGAITIAVLVAWAIASVVAVRWSIASPTSPTSLSGTHVLVS